MGVKAEKLREDSSSRVNHIQDAAKLNKAEGAIVACPSQAEEVFDNFLLSLDQADASRQVEVESIFDSIFGRVGCYNCGLVGLDVKLHPEDIMRFDTQVPVPGATPVSHDS